MQMPTNRKEAGFTLIEMAIVLVIIGLIIGAVLKGQDLIQNARAKKFVNFVRAAEIAQWTWLDRKGYFNGDEDHEGLITNATISWDGMVNVPDNSTVLGSYSYSLFYGYENSTDSGNPKNIIMITPTSADTFTEDEFVFLDSLDTAIDGSSDASEGRVVGLTSDAPTTNGQLTSVTLTGNDDYTTDVTTVIYYFDKK